MLYKLIKEHGGDLRIPVMLPELEAENWGSYVLNEGPLGGLMFGGLLWNISGNYHNEGQFINYSFRMAAMMQRGMGWE